MPLTEAEEIDREREGLFMRNRIANRMHSQVTSKLTSPASDDLWTEYELTEQMLFQTVKDLVLLSRVGDKVETTNGSMVVAEKRVSSWNDNVEMVLTRDGLPYVNEWDEEPTVNVCVYVEVITTDGLRFHGWVDSVSRRIVLGE